MNHLLIVDDEPNISKAIRRIFRDTEFKFTHVFNGKEGLKAVQKDPPQIIISDHKMPEMTGLEFLKSLKVLYPTIPVLILTAYGNNDQGVSFLKEGADRYLEKPFNSEELKLTVLDLLEISRIKNEALISASPPFKTTTNLSPRMQECYTQIQKVARTSATILITGESGTGKSMLAKQIHQKSGQSTFPFVHINCACSTDTMIDSELFGHEKGAFTGADVLKPGKFELAQNGTIFFDEIGDLDLKIQAKLLRILQEKQYERVGGTHTLTTNARVMAASHQNLEKKVETGQFREDLFFRLHVFPIHVPPLRERIDDIEPLCLDLLAKIHTSLNIPLKTLHSSALRLLKTNEWKGNIRELENTLTKAAILCSEPVIPDTLLISIGVKHSLIGSSPNPVLLLSEEELVKNHAKSIYKHTGGNKAETCRILEINFRTLQSRLS